MSIEIPPESNFKCYNLVFKINLLKVYSVISRDTIMPNFAAMDLNGHRIRVF